MPEMWLRNPELRHIVYTAHTLLCSMTGAAAGQAQSACQFKQRTIYEQIVTINIDVLTNTTFFPIPDVGITVSNAPTSIDTVTTFYYTTGTRTVADDTTAVTQTTSLFTVTPTVALDQFVMMIQSSDQVTHDERKIHQKRQSGSYYVNASELSRTLDLAEDG